MCKFIGADTYLSGSGGKNYVNENQFTEANINVQWHSYEHPTYNQCFSGFEPNMSIIDLLFNEGPKAKDILLKGGIIETKKAVETGVIKPLIVQEAEAI